MKFSLIILGIVFIASIFLGNKQKSLNNKNNNTDDTNEYSYVKIKEFPVALQCWTFRKFSFYETLDKASDLNIKNIQAYPGQKLFPKGESVFGIEMTPEEISLVQEKMNKLNLNLKLFGVVNLDNLESAVAVFEFAKKMGIEIIVSEPEFDFLPTIDSLAKSYNIKVAIHNHPAPSKYWDPQIVYDNIKNLSPQIGVCGDTGHWLRSGTNPIEALKLLKGRILDLHLKDLNEFGEKSAYDVPFGNGIANIHDILAELSLQNYHRTITVEYEKDSESKNPSPSIKIGLDYINRITYYEGYKELLGWWNDKFNKHGWNHYGPGYFELDENTGVLTSNGGMGLFWYSAKKFSDFVLDLEFLCHAPNTNSGVFLRVPDLITSDNYIFKSFEIQISDMEIPTIHSTGAVYDAEAAKLNASNKTGQWNHFRITFEGDLIKVELNEQLIINWKAEPRGKIKSFANEGYIGLQNHDSNAKVSFRNLFIKELN